MRITHIEAIRGVSAFAVVVFHLFYCSALLHLDSAHTPLHLLKAEAFFVVTGFVLPYGLYKYNYRRSLFGGFLLKRLVRLYPPFAATVLFCVLLALVAGGLLPTLKQLVLQTFFLNGIAGEVWVPPPLWTLAIELQFYVFIGLAYPLFVTKSHRRFAGLLLLFLSLAWLSRQTGGEGRWLPYYSGYFLCGTLVFRRWVLGLSSTAFAGSLLTVLAGIWLVNGWAFAFTAGLTTALVLFFRPEKTGWLGRALHGLGKMSYSLYLVHWPVGLSFINVLRRVNFFVHHPVLRIVAGLAVSLLAAWLMYTLVEKKAAQWSRHLLLRPIPNNDPVPGALAGQHGLVRRLKRTALVRSNDALLRRHRV